jgi:hypothetical protein
MKDFAQAIAPAVEAPAIPALHCLGIRVGPGFPDPDPDPHGMAALLFGFAPAGRGRLARLAQSLWFHDPRAAPADRVRRGDRPSLWSLPDDSPRVLEDDEASLADLPPAWWAAIAVTPDTLPAGRETLLRLVAALRQRRLDGSADALPVVVTLEGTAARDADLVADLSALGAFAILPGREAAGDDFHHYPVRCLAGGAQIICVDLFDTLALWRPGRTAVLHRIPFDDALPDDAREAIVASATGAEGTDLRMADGHASPDDVLLRLDGLYDRWLDALGLGDDSHTLLGTMQRLDGDLASGDLLVVRPASARGSGRRPAEPAQGGPALRRPAPFA